MYTTLLCLKRLDDHVYVYAVIGAKLEHSGKMTSKFHLAVVAMKQLCLVHEAEQCA